MLPMLLRSGPIPCSRPRLRRLRFAAALVPGLWLCLSAPPARAAWTPPPGTDLTRPRLLFRAPDLPEIQARLEREPYRGIALGMLGRIAQADAIALADHTIDGERIKARAAKSLSFFYAIDRIPQNGRVEPFPFPAARQDAGDRVRDWLLHMYTESRLAVPPPLGGSDRDISTSEELLQYATAYDTLKGGGYPFAPADEARILDNLVDLASALYRNYVDPASAGYFSLQHQNNHRSKTGASLVAAAIAVAEYTPAPGSDPEGVRDPALWVPYGLDQIDKIMRWALVAGDGAYGEGPFYLRFACQNLLPFFRAWDRLVDGRDTDVGGHRVPSFWRHPLFARTMRWTLDMTLPDGSLGHIDDGNPYRSFYFGAAPPGADARAFAWRWANAPAPYEVDGNVDLGADAIVAFDDRVDPAPPSGSPTAFYTEGGNAIFRSDWSPEAVVAIALAEYGAAAEFGRDRFGLGVSPESHEHADPGSFLLHAYGERLALDPGYGTFPERARVNQPEHHNVILVDGAGPRSFIGASVAWPVDLAGPRPGDGDAMLSENLDGDFLDATRATTQYGSPAARIERRFLFADDRYLVLADLVERSQTPGPVVTWLLHGHGGGTSGGSYEDHGPGGRWTFGAGRLDAAFAAAGASATRDTAESEHEGPGRQYLTHTVLRTRAAPPTGASELRSIGLAYPSRSTEPAPTWLPLAVPGAAALALEDAAADRRLAVAHRAPGPGALSLAGVAGLPEAATDGHLLLVDARAATGALRLAWVEGATWLDLAGTRHLRGRTPGALGLRLSPGRAEIVVANADPLARVTGLPFRPRSVDHACGLDVARHGSYVTLNRERRFVLRAESGNGAPAADAGPDRRVSWGGWVTLDGTASCDPDGDRLEPHWELVSAPAGSGWVLERADSWHPQLEVDRPGPFRVRLVVTDAHGARSREIEVGVLAGETCENTVDDDLDGLFDAADPDCDALVLPPVPVAVDDAYTVEAGHASESPRSVLENDPVSVGQARVAVLMAGPSHGELGLHPDGTFVYRPDAGFTGEDAFRYRVRDATWQESAPASVVLTVRSVDRLDLQFGGRLRHRVQGVLESGDLRIERDEAGRLRGVRGAGSVAGVAGPVRIALELERPRGRGPLSGSVVVRDPALGPQPVEMRVRGSAPRELGDSVWGRARSVDRQGRPLRLRWAVQDG